MTTARRLRAPMPQSLRHAVVQALLLGGTLLTAVGCSDDTGPDGIDKASSGGSIATSATHSVTGGATVSNGSGGTTATAAGGSTQASTLVASAGSMAGGGSTSSAAGSSPRASGGMTGTGGTQGGGASGGQSSGGTPASSAQSSGGSGGRSNIVQSSGGSGGRSSSAQSSGGQSSGGTRASSSQSAGGSTGGTPASSTSVSTGNPNTIGPNKTCGCLTSSGNYSGNPLTATIVVDAGETYDGGCKTYTTKSLSSGGLGDGSQEENQKPLFRVNGGKIMNVILGTPAADGVHFHGNATAQNIHWLDIGEDASTIKANATVTMDCGSAKNGSDKVFQVNAKATWNISNFTIKGAGKGMRENGGECYPVNAVFDHCDISSLDEVIFRTDCSSSKVTISNTRYSGLGDGLVMIGDKIYNSSSGNVTITNVQKY